MITTIEAKDGQPVGSLGQLLSETGIIACKLSLRPRADGGLELSLRWTDDSHILIVLEMPEALGLLAVTAEEGRSLLTTLPGTTRN